MNGYGSSLVYGGSQALDAALYAHRAGVGTGSAGRICKSSPRALACVHGVLSAVLYLFYLLKTFSLFVVAGESDQHFRVTGGRCPPQFMHTFCDASNEITMRC